MRELKVLVTGVGGPTPRSMAMALKKYSTISDITLYATDINPFSIGLYQNDIFEKSFIVPSCNQASYWETIYKIIKEHEIEFALVSPELEVIEWAKQKALNEIPCKVLLPDVKIAEAVYNKKSLVEHLMPIGVVPKSLDLKLADYNAKEVFEVLGESFWVRSAVGSSGLAAMHVKNKEELAAWIKINTNITSFLASQYLPGRNLACKLLYYNDKLVRSATVERNSYIMAKTAVSGITGNVSRGTFLNEPNIVDVASNALNYLFKKFNVSKHGFFTVDLKEDENGCPFITEINIRHIATTQCFAAAGANFVEDSIRLLDEDKSYDEKYKMYEFEKDLMFLREVDTEPILINKNNILKAL